MLWVTTTHIHLDRVASPWLIDRFVDDEAVFDFVHPRDPVPSDAIPFGIPGAELGPHDEHGSTFRKIREKFPKRDPELDRMTICVELGIALAVGLPLPDAPADLVDHARSMAAFSEAMAVLHADDDATNLASSSAFYDALYVSLWSTGQAAPDLPGDVRGRIAAIRGARDWATILPPSSRPRIGTMP